jgi:putative selenium metabolism protein SsnA
MKLFLRNATILEYCPSRVEGPVDITVENGMIADVKPARGGAPDGDRGGEVFDCTGLVVMPAFVIGHTHLYSSFATGMPAPRKSPANFVEILQYVWWVLDRALDDEGVYYSALVGAIRAALGGASTLVDHHASPNAIRGSLANVRRGLERVGLRGVLCYEVTDRNGPEGAKQGIEENAAFLTSGCKPGWFGGLFGAHAPFTLGDATLRAVAEGAEACQVGVHIHCAESNDDNEDSLRRCGRRAVGRLLESGLLRPGSVIVHGTHLTAEEIRMIYDQGCWIAHNPRSNMNNHVGYANIEAMTAGRLALGTDGIDADMLTESKVAFFKARDAGAAIPYDAPLRWLGGSAQLATEVLGVPLGQVRPGYAADLALLEYPAATPLKGENVAGHWFFSFSPANIHSTIVGGRWVMRNRRLADETLYGELEKAQIVAQKIWRRLGDLA